MPEDKRKHLEFIQNVITRMNKNSFQIKAWTVTIVAAILVIYARFQNVYVLLVGIFPAIIFWFLDAYYLKQERQFRGLYNDAARVSDEPKDKDVKLFSMNTGAYTGGNYGYWKVFVSRTICLFYLPIIVVLIVLFIIFCYCSL